jgi:hypothetical protein
VFRIVMIAALLVAIIVLQRPCADAVGKFVTGFGKRAAQTGDAGVAPAGSPVDAGGVDPYRGPYIQITPDMTEDELRRRLDEAGVERAGDAGVD